MDLSGSWKGRDGECQVGQWQLWLLQVVRLLCTLSNSQSQRMGAGNKYELRTAIPPPPPTPPPIPTPESEYESEYEEEEEEIPPPPPPPRTPTPPPPQCEMCGLLLTENCLRWIRFSVLQIIVVKLSAPRCALSARASCGEGRPLGESSPTPPRLLR